MYLKRRQLSKAFDLLKTWHAGQYVITNERWVNLMKFLHPDMSATQMELYLYVLTGGNDEISKNLWAESQAYIPQKRTLIQVLSLCKSFCSCIYMCICYEQTTKAFA